MGYTALYRKFRPSVFEEVKGQDHVVSTLRNQIKADRVGHAYLFCGTRGTGKTSIAKLFAKAVNCEHPVDGSPCGQCETCKHIGAGTSMNVIEIDAASNNGVDNIRDIIDEVSYSPTEGRYKVYIIDEVHMLSTGAFNALLKTLEEPPSYVIFILATTEVHKIPLTILSRCQRYDFKRISIETITDRLKELMEKEQIAVTDKALRYIARTADGSMRDALSILDQCIAFHYGEELTYDMALDVLGAVNTDIFSNLLRAVLEQNVLQCITLLEEVIMQGRELVSFVTDFTWYLRNLLLIQASDNMEEVIDMSSENLLRLKEEAKLCDRETITRYIRIFSELAGQIKFASQKRILIEVALIKLCRPDMEHTQDALLDRIRVLEEKIEKGVAVAQPVVMETPKKTVVKAALPKAVPEDIKQVVASWKGFTATLEPPLKMYASGAMLSLGGDNQLLLVVNNTTAYDYLAKEAGNLDRLEEKIAEYFEKDIKVLVQETDSREESEATFPDLSRLIQVDIQEEE